nr:ribonuclease H-like domain-containing protein [Tanacetum cinerariifolium]
MWLLYPPRAQTSQAAQMKQITLLMKLVLLLFKLAREDLEQIDPDDLEEMGLHWEMAMLTLRARRFIKRTCRNLDRNGQKISFDMSKVECFNCYKNRHFAREFRALKNQENRGKDYGRKNMPMENPTENALIAQGMIEATKLKKSILQTMH